MAKHASKIGWINFNRRSKASNPSLACYTIRDKTLRKKLGFDSYHEYLQSDIWKYIRSEQLRWFPNCIACNSPATEVHHVRYNERTLIGVGFIDTVSVCHKCHEACEFSEGKKNSLWDANGVLMKLSGLSSLKQLLKHRIRIRGGKRPKDNKEQT